MIAVDELTITDVTCSQESVERSGFQLLCNESVRFTHAFSPSTLTVPALSSLLTGLYPFQHKVRHNGGPGLAAEIDLVSELALRRDYRTSFFSGGAPVFRRTGLNQGFELFEDNIVPNFKTLIRPFNKNAEAFTQWLDQEVGKNSFFSVIYVPDLLFSTTETVTDLGETRNLSFESQVDELDESLYELINKLKATQRWDSTTVIFAGLNGHTTSERYRELSSLNLHGENTQVALFIKPAQKKKRDEAIHWKIDQNVSIVDVGRTLYELLGETIVETNPSFPAHSLLNVLKSPNVNWPEDRPLLIESGWALWRKAGPLRTAAISNHVLYINDEKPLLYNTLVDRFEVNPLPLLQESILPTTQRLQGLLSKFQFPAFPPLSSEWNAKLSIPYARWMRPDQEFSLLKDLKRLSSSQTQSLDLLNWTAQIALNQKDWETLKQLGSKNRVQAWQYVGEKNLNSKSAKISDPCFLLLTDKVLEAEQLKNCSDPLFLEFIDWLRAEDRGLAKDTQKKRFERSFRNYMLDQQIQRTNIAAGLIWDTSRDNIFAPSRTELALHLPEYGKIRAQVYKSIQTEEY
ncbi:sulfatase-like hydrolase/transferase [Bdellovibrio sp. 22V]|uniref:sulfatase-like hydrolase/transferase n=1 Tax=Bdellovibrio TaxID=958 RepID=UPI0025428AB1|nr:sulfatase-like hydrolase/transferase [Bdellovibrio sp. 22V]WII70630.1 sulfatase-like hydrolase/transferase [Bdellovibrio sp. 22V]